MTVYMLYLLLAGLQLPLFYRRNASGERIFEKSKYLVLCCLEIIVLAGVRGYTVGADTSLYLSAIDHYSTMKPLELIHAKLVTPFKFEAGYFALNKLCILLGMNKTEFLFTVAIMVYVPLYYTICKYSSSPYISILAYFAFGYFSYSLGIFRQMIAISILLCGWNCVVERRFFNYLLITAFATLFHTTALLGIALYFVYGCRWKRLFWLLPVAELFLLIYARSIVVFAFSLFPRFTNYLGGKYDVSGGSYLNLIFLNMILIMWCVLNYKNKKEEKSVVASSLVLAICLQSLGYSMGLFGRAVAYYSIYTIFAIPDILSRLDKKSQAVCKPVVAGILFLMSFFVLNGDQYIIPYYTVFA